jgi:hypothetical protein
MTYSQIPYAKEQGVFWSEQGIESRDQGIFSIEELRREFKLQAYPHVCRSM